MSIRDDVVKHSEQRARQQSPGARMVREANEQREREFEMLNQQAYANLGPMQQYLPSAEQYDYRAAESAGHDVSAGDLPNQFFKPGHKFVDGIDIVSGEHRMPASFENNAQEREELHQSFKQIDDMLRGGARAVGGGLADAASGTAEFMQEMTGSVADKLRGLGLEEGLIKDVVDVYAQAFEGGEYLWSHIDDAVPEVPENEGFIGSFARDIVQFAAGVWGAGKIGAIRQAGGLTGPALQGALAGQTFDPEEGNLSTFLDDLGLLPDVLQFLNARNTAENHGRWAGRLSLALEEAGLTVMFPALFAGTLAAKRQWARSAEDLKQAGREKQLQASTLFSGLDPQLMVGMVEEGMGVVKERMSKASLEAASTEAELYLKHGGTEQEYFKTMKDATIPEPVAREAWDAKVLEKDIAESPLHDHYRNETGPATQSRQLPPEQHLEPATVREKGTPVEMMVKGTGAKATAPVTQGWLPSNVETNLGNIDQIKASYPDALDNPRAWTDMQQSAYGGKSQWAPPYRAIEYHRDPKQMANMLNRLSPNLKAAVDEGFKMVEQIRMNYETGGATPSSTGELFLWGMLSRGVGPMPQEGTFLNIIQEVAPLIDQAAAGVFDEKAAEEWVDIVSQIYAPGHGLMGASAKMNANASAKMMMALGQPLEDGRIPLQELHETLANGTGREFRRQFFELTGLSGIKPGIDNKVVSFIGLVAGKTDMFVMDRIQTAHMWDSNRYPVDNIYDGFIRETTPGKQTNEGFASQLQGPSGLLTHEALEEGLEGAVEEAYTMIGRPDDASIGRFHWETWVIQSGQAVSHSTLKGFTMPRRPGANRSPHVGSYVEEGKFTEINAGVRYTLTDEGPRPFYPLSSGGYAAMTPSRYTEFKKALDKEGRKRGIFPKGFKRGKPAGDDTVDRFWFEYLPDENRAKLDELAREHAYDVSAGGVAATR